MKPKNMILLLPFGIALLFLAALLLLLDPRPTTASRVPSAYEDQPVTITYWHHNTGDREDFLNELVSEFNADNLYNITVQAESLGSYYALYDAVIDGLQNDGSLPNVVVAYPSHFADFARYGAVRFLDDYFYDPEIGITDPTDFYPGVLDYYRLGEYGNQLAGLQNGRSIYLMYYNADMLAGEGLAVPTTWEAFETACISLTTETISGTIVGTGASDFATYLWSWGGELLSPDLNSAQFDQQPGIYSLVFFQNLVNEGYARLPGGTYPNVPFGSGQVALTFGSSAGIPYYRADMENGVNADWGVTRIPANPGNEVVNTYGGGQGVLHHDEISDRASWLFIKWLSDGEQTARWAAVSSYFPVRVSATTHISMTQKFSDDPQYTQAHSLLDLGRGEPAIRGYVAIRGLIENALVETLEGGADVTTSLQTAAQGVDLVLDSSGPDSAEITPSGGTLIFTSTQGISSTVEFPAGALVMTETVSYVPLEDLPTDGLAFALVPDLVFEQPVTITLHYQDEDIIGMDEDNLRLYNYDWGTHTWVDADPCGGYMRYPVDNILEAAVCHFSDYGMIDWLSKVFLPMTVR